MIPGDPLSTGEEPPDIAHLLRQATAMLAHEHSLFRTLNIEPRVLGAGETRVALDLSHDFADHRGAVHTGLATIILDSLMGVSVLTFLRAITPIATVNLRTDFLHATPAGQRAICSSRCETMIGDIAYVSADLSLDTGGPEAGRTLARARGTFMVGTKGPVRRGETRGARL